MLDFEGLLPIQMDDYNITSVRIQISRGSWHLVKFFKFDKVKVVFLRCIKKNRIEAD